MANWARVEAAWPDVDAYILSVVNKLEGITLP
jgi:hypothetical protein